MLITNYPHSNLFLILKFPKTNIFEIWKFLITFIPMMIKPTKITIMKNSHIIVTMQKVIFKHLHFFPQLITIITLQYNLIPINKIYYCSFLSSNIERRPSSNKKLKKTNKLVTGLYNHSYTQIENIFADAVERTGKLYFSFMHVDHLIDWSSLHHDLLV